MASKVGAKGNIVIDKEIRDRLGIEAGWEAVQLLRDGYVEIYFLPPVEPGGSAGRLSQGGNTSRLETAEGFRQAREEALGAAAAEQYSGLVRKQEP